MPNLSSLDLQIKTFTQLTRDQLYDLAQLRVDVFVVEQACAYRELDDRDRDQQTRHLLYYVKEVHQDRPILAAYARLLAPQSQSQPVAAIGRIIVARPYRGNALGDRVIKEAIDQIKQLWPLAVIQLNAQVTLKDYYENHNFKVISESKIEDGIAHVMMQYCEDADKKNEDQQDRLRR